MKKPKHLKTLLIDMDGTLANSIPLLYDVYVDFMKRLGLKPTSEEFSELIGPSLCTILDFLKERYSLPQEIRDLATIYHDLLEKRYNEPISLMPGSRECLSYAKEKGLRCILVTSASHSLAKSFIHHQQLENDFDYLITGEMASKGKPDPTLYLIALEKGEITPREALAIEDSTNGVQAASAAHIQTLWLAHNSEHHSVSQEYVHIVRSWYEILSLLKSWYEPSVRYEMIPLDEAFSIHVLSDENSAFNLETVLQDHIDKLWNEAYELSGNKLFNGKIFILKAFNDNQLKGYFIEYKLYLAQMRDPSLREVLPIEAVTINGLTCAGDKILVGQRSPLMATHQGLWELVPSGGIDPTAVQDQSIDYSGAALRELEEETGITPPAVLSVTPLAICRALNCGLDCAKDSVCEDRKANLVEICVKIEIHEETIKTFDPPKTEYTSFEWLDKKALETMISDHPNSFVPLSIFLFETFIH
jgi:HAD superfamily hydrolase (TIGR01509 family)